MLLFCCSVPFQRVTVVIACARIAAAGTRPVVDAAQVTFQPIEVLVVNSVFGPRNPTLWALLGWLLLHPGFRLCNKFQVKHL